MNWKNEFRVGIRDIDEQHQEIITCISSIKQAVAQQDRWSDVHLGFVNLADLAQIHFKVEESLMRILDYPRLAEHVEDHKQFLAVLKTLKERVLTTHVSQDNIHSLHEWWEKHIQMHDKPYALHFLKRTALGKS
jgi:hemerythrin